MKKLILKDDVVIAGVRHTPSDGVLMMEDEAAHALIEAKLAEDGGDDLDGQTIAQLTATAAAETAPIDGLTLRDDILAGIRAHREAVKVAEHLDA